MRLLITGGCGFLGSNIASEALKLNYDVFIFDNLSRDGCQKNLKWLQLQEDFTFFNNDIRFSDQINKVIKDVKPDVVFHLAGQVAMTTSLANPRLDFETNVLGTHNLLEAIRLFSPNTQTIYSSTNKVYGDLEEYDYKETATRYEIIGKEKGLDETIGLDFRSPYGCSKGAADQYMLDYSRNFDLQNIVFRHSSIFGGRQFSSFDQGWVGWFVEKALEKKKNKEVEPFTISGDGKQVRDVLFASDLIKCYFSAISSMDTCSGEAFNIGGGMVNSLSLLELFNFLEEALSVELEYKNLDWRLNDQKVFVADISKAKEKFDWTPAVSKQEGLLRMIEWVKSDV